MTSADPATMAIWHTAASAVDSAVNALRVGATPAVVAHQVDMAELILERCPDGDAKHLLSLVLDSVERLRACGRHTDSDALQQRIVCAGRALAELADAASNARAASEQD